MQLTSASRRPTSACRRLSSLAARLHMPNWRLTSCSRRLPTRMTRRHSAARRLSSTIVDPPMRTSHLPSAVRRLHTSAPRLRTVHRGSLEQLRSTRVRPVVRASISPSDRSTTRSLATTSYVVHFARRRPITRRRADSFPVRLPLRGRTNAEAVARAMEARCARSAGALRDLADAPRLSAGTYAGPPVPLAPAARTRRRRRSDP
jgi:hypothetical protein